MAQRREWRSGEVAFLQEKAGEIPLSQIARFLGRSERSVKMMAHRLGLSLRCARWDLAWCPRCASWRSAVAGCARCTSAQRGAAANASRPTSR